MPMCFEIRLRNGSVETFPCRDLRNARLLHAVCLFVYVYVYGMEKYQIVIEGRRLDELEKKHRLWADSLVRRKPKA